MGCFLPGCNPVGVFQPNFVQRGYRELPANRDAEMPGVLFSARMTEFLIPAGRLLNDSTSMRQIVTFNANSIRPSVHGTSRSISTAGKTLRLQRVCGMVLTQDFDDTSDGSCTRWCSRSRPHRSREPAWGERRVYLSVA